MNQVEENITNINKWAYIVDVVNINDDDRNTVYLHGIIVLLASHDEHWLRSNISPLCTYNPLPVHPDQWATTFNYNLHHNPHLGFFLEIGERPYGDVAEEDYWHFH
jgi:hypothetical protein